MTTTADAGATPPVDGAGTFEYALPSLGADMDDLLSFAKAIQGEIDVNGGLDIVVHNTGGPKSGPILEKTEEDMLGVDLVLPDFTYLRERADRIEGAVLTHAHEDHTGNCAAIAAAHRCRQDIDRPNTGAFLA